MSAPEATRRAAARLAATRIKLLALDVDGILTDGSIVWETSVDEPRAPREIKTFNVRDGLGIKAWQAVGNIVAIVSARASAVTALRAAELGIALCYHGRHGPAGWDGAGKSKLAALDDALARTGLTREQTAFMGDDWPDLAVLRSVGLAITVPEADDAVRGACGLVTRADGGRGAVREAIEFILDAQGVLEATRERIAGGPMPGG
ncbi:MAG: HAD hydrolase family protein [Planctomycetota bacterium]|nr:HAD hydrolase family protein [Planctomycetota bacterium]